MSRFKDAYFEIACSHKVFKSKVGCEFQLAKTKQEQALGRWEQAVTDHGTKYTTKMAVDEPKQLVAKVAAYPMGVSIPERVKVYPIGSSIIEEAFIPVIPSVQLGERLGLPTQGYYYHFHNGRLVQEYKLLGDKKWAFYATCSTHDKLNDEQGFNIVQSAILVYWKLGGKNVEDQSLVYLEQQITREELDDLNEDWIEQNGIKLDIQQLLDVPRQPDENCKLATYFNPLKCTYEYPSDQLTNSTLRSLNHREIVSNELVIINLRKVEEVIDFKCGFSVIEKEIPLDDYWHQVLSDSSTELQEITKSYNQHLNDPLIPGEIVVFVTTEASSEEDKAQLSVLQEEAKIGSEELGKLSPEQRKLHKNYFEVLENKFVEYWNNGNPSDTYAYMGTAVGTIAPAMQKNLEGVSSSLNKVDELYIKFLSKKIDRASFVRQRQGLSKILEKQLDKLTQTTLSIPIDEGLKNSLGLRSTKSLIHNSDQILKNGAVPTLGKRIANTAKWVRYAESAGKIGVGLGAASAVYNVAAKCTGLESCARQVVVESGGVAGGWAGGTLGVAAAGTVVTALSIAAAPVVMVVVGVGALTGGIIGGGVGKEFAGKAYELTNLEDYLTELEKTIDENAKLELKTDITNSQFNNFSIHKAFGGL